VVLDKREIEDKGVKLDGLEVSIASRCMWKVLQKEDSKLD